MTRPLAAIVKEHMQAGFSGLWIVTEEPEDTILQLAALKKEEQWLAAHWDADAGLSGTKGTEDPVAALHAACNISLEGDARALTIFRHLHRFLHDAVTVAALLNALQRGAEMGVTLIVLSPHSEIPEELSRRFAVIHQPLPTREALAKLANVTLAELGPLDETEAHTVLDAASGLTRLEAENAYALSLVRHNRIDPTEVWDIKTQTLEKSNVLKLHRGKERFAQIGGLDALKTFMTRSLRQGRRETPKGVLLLGVPGTGKSAIAKALGAETGRPCLTLDLASLFGSLVGQSEGAMRRALATADAMAPAVLFIDEVEKGLAGAQGGENDGGTARRMFGTLLTWLNDHTSDVYVVATSNDVSALPPEFARPGRFDALWMLDTPGERERAMIWSIWRAHYDIGPTDPTPRHCMDWTGAEVQACCRTAALLDITLDEASRYIVPVATTYAEKIRSLRAWATHRALDAQHGAPYVDPSNRPAPQPALGEGRRRIERD